MKIQQYDFIGENGWKYFGTEVEDGAFILVSDAEEFVREITKASIDDYNEFQSLSDYAEIQEERVAELVAMLDKSVKTIDMLSKSGILGFGFDTTEANDMLDDYR